MTRLPDEVPGKWPPAALARLRARITSTQAYGLLSLLVFGPMAMNALVADKAIRIPAVCALVVVLAGVYWLLRLDRAIQRPGPNVHRHNGADGFDGDGGGE